MEYIGIMKLIERVNYLNQLNAVKNISAIQRLAQDMQKDGIRIIDIARWLSDSE